MKKGYTKKRLAGLKTKPKLPAGHKTTAVRVSGPAELVEWFADPLLTPAARGEMLRHVYESQKKKSVVEVLPGTPLLFEGVQEVTPVRESKRGKKSTGTLTPGLRRVLGLLFVPGAVARFSEEEGGWVAGLSSVPVSVGELEELCVLGRLRRVGEGEEAVYSVPRKS